MTEEGMEAKSKQREEEIRDTSSFERGKTSSHYPTDFIQNYRFCFKR
jgi:hypothetical protein